ncbi:MAG: glycosyl hydrolase [Bacteroidota bacterium]
MSTSLLPSSGKKLIAVLLLATPFIAKVSAQNAPWQKLTFPTHSEMAANLKAYPLPYAETVTWGMQGPVSRENIIKDLDDMKSRGLRSVTIEAGYKMNDPYLSDGWFKTVQVIVEELKKRDMHLWIIDEGKYPSGFAGGKFSQEKPELRMQGLVVAKRIPLKQGETANQALDASIISAVAVNNETKANEVIDVSKHTLNWTAKQGDWQVMLIQHRFKTSVTRAANNPTGGKDTVNSLCDYLNPLATRQFLEFTHVQYKKYIGNEFGKTVLGFRGDEPEYNFTPWTPGLDAIFQTKKGYDIKPYIGTFFTQNATKEQKLAKADFWEVWSDLYRDNFFKIQGDWCAQNGLEYMVHIDHEDMLMDLAKTEGDYFKDMRYVQVPGVDAIWHQIWYDNVTDFPKLASSAAHLFGRPRALSESFAAYTPKPTVDDARWVVNEQLVRGINLFEFMFWSSSAGGRGGASGYMADPKFPALTEYANRASYLLSNGRPAAQVGIYCPTESMWLGNKDANTSLLAISKQLLEHQVDFDYVDNQSLESVFKLGKGTFTNMSGQAYKAIIIPTVSILTAPAVARLQAFAQSGGKVIFAGQLPEMVTGKNYLDAKTPAAMSWATTTQLTDDVIKKLPMDVQLDKAIPSIKYLHRSWKDAEFYFFFNEGDQAQSVKATLAGTGKTELWDAGTGSISPVSNTTAKAGQTSMTLDLDAHQTKFIIIHTSK